MDALDPTACFMVGDDLLDFTLDDEDKATTKDPSFSSLESSNANSQDVPDDHSRSFPEFVEEELEWLSNKDAFPGLDTCLDIFSESPGVVTNALSPVSILENSSTSSSTGYSNGSTVMSCCGGIRVPVQYPVRARSKCRRRRRRGGFPELPGQQCWWWNQGNDAKQDSTFPPRSTGSTVIGRRCQHCQAEKTPQWRAGPMGPKTLCNACGVRYKSGRLVPEYRPAISPTFSSALHSNSHRKVMEMRRQKQLAMAGIGVNEACGYRVG